MTETCRIQVSDAGGWHFRQCGRPSKGEIDGKPMCGIHLAAHRRREERLRNNQEAKERKEAYHTELDDWCKLIAKAGLSVYLTNDNRVVIEDPEVALKELEDIRWEGQGHD